MWNGRDESGKMGEVAMTTVSSCLLSYSGHVAPKENGARALAEEALFCLFQM